MSPQPGGPFQGWKIRGLGFFEQLLLLHPSLCGYFYKFSTGLLLKSIEACQIILAILMLSLAICNLQLLQTTNNSPMNSKPQQIKMQSTKKGAVTKREDGVTAAGMAAGGPAAGDEAPSTAAAPLTPTALQPLVSEENTIFIFAIYVMVSCVGGRVL